MPFVLPAMTQFPGERPAAPEAAKRVSPSISFIVPAYNEEENLEGAVREAKGAAESLGLDFEILIFDDRSSDRTPEIADRLAAEDPRVRAIHNPVNRGLGYNYFAGVEAAAKDYVVMFPGDNETPRESIVKMLGLMGKADLIVPFVVNPEVRPLPRRAISRLFVFGLNLLFGRRLRYYNGPCVLRRNWVLSARIRTEGFAYMAAILIQALADGATIVEVGVPTRHRPGGTSKAFEFRNVRSVFATIARLFRAVRLKRS